MKYTIVKQWTTLDGSYYSDTFDKSNYDTAIGDFYSMFKPMQNDKNVAYFKLHLMDEMGNEPIKPISWTRKTGPTEEVATELV